MANSCLLFLFHNMISLASYSCQISNHKTNFVRCLCNISCTKQLFLNSSWGIKLSMEYKWIFAKWKYVVFCLCHCYYAKPQWLGYFAWLKWLKDCGQQHLYNCCVFVVFKKDSLNFIISCLLYLNIIKIYDKKEVISILQVKTYWIWLHVSCSWNF